MSTWDDLGGEVDNESDLDRVRRDRDNLARQLYEVKRKHSDYLETLFQAVSDSIARTPFKPVKAPAKRKAGSGSEEICVPLLSDTQIGKKTPTYDTEVCRQRVEKYAQKIIEITEIQRADHPVNHCRGALLGDMLENCDIFPGQQWLLDSTLYDQIFNTVEIIVTFARTLLTSFDTVELDAVDGNHGRIGRRGQFGPMDNVDRIIYRMVQQRLANEPRFKLNMTDPEGERNWYRIMEVGNYKALLIHGDQIRGHSGFPWYGLGKKVQGWGSGGLGDDSDFRDVFMGHYHQIARVPLNHRSVWANGTTESSNTFAAEVLAAQSEPSQWLLYIHPEKGRVTASYGVELGENNG